MYEYSKINFKLGKKLYFKKKNIKKKKIYFFLLIIIFLIFLVFGWISVIKGKSFFLVKLVPIHQIIPQNIQNVLRNTIFYIPNLQKKFEKQQDQIKNFKHQQKHSYELWNIVNKSEFSEINSYSYDKKFIKSKLNTYGVRFFSLPFPNIYISQRKPVAYLEQFNNKIILATGDGVFFNFEKKVISEFMINKNLESNVNKLILKKINTNFKTVVTDENLFSKGMSSIRDLLIFKKKIFVSYTKKISDNCYNTSILYSDLNFSFLYFEEFFSYKECHLTNDFDNAGSGGRMVPFKDNKILLTIGVAKQVITNKKSAQNKNSFFGKIISIDIKTRDHELISMGHRNPQGLYYENDKNIILSTEHGPKGGDEININKNPDNLIIENYGWPISSYGKHYDKSTTPKLKKSHKKFGFKEPIKYYTPAIGISELIKIPENFNKKFTNDFFVGSLGSDINEGDLSIHHIRFDENFDKIKYEEILPIGQRIRDMIYINEIKIVLLTLEDKPSIGMLKIFN